MAVVGCDPRRSAGGRDLERASAPASVLPGPAAGRVHPPSAGSAAIAADLTTLVTDVVDALGYAGVAVLVALESVFPPIPSEVVLPLAGFVAGRGDASLPGMVLAATVGSVLGSWVLYAVSAWIGPERLHRLVVRHGRWVRLDETDLVRAETWFDRRSDAAVLLGRCVPLVRSIVSIPAGFRRMRFWRFTVLTALGSLMWNAALIGAGAVLGDRWHEVGDVVGLLQAAVILGAVGGAAWFGWTRLVRPRLTRTVDLAAETAAETTDETAEPAPEADR